MFQQQYQQSGWLVREVPATKPSHLSRTTIFALRTNRVDCPDVLSKGSYFRNRKQVYRFRKSTHIYSQLTGTWGTSELCKNHLRDAGSIPIKSNEDLMIGYSKFCSACFNVGWPSLWIVDVLSIADTFRNPKRRGPEPIYKAQSIRHWLLLAITTQKLIVG